jgi:hypothetical protein
MSLWAFCAAFALAVAAYAGTTELGRGRMKQAATEIHEVFAPSGVTPPRPLDAVEGQRLAENVRALSAERERLATRVASLERGLTEVTGSIARVEQTALAVTAAAAKAAALPDITASIGPPAASVPMPPPAPAGATTAEYGLDLGSGANVEALRALWAATLRRYSTLLAGLHPLVQMRDHARPGAVDLHLVVGPIPNAATAARLCATITAAGAVCQPSSYDGQRLALR